MSPSVCACVCLLLAVLAVGGEGDKHKRDIMSPIYNEPSSFFDRRSHVRRHVGEHHHHHHHHRDVQPWWMETTPAPLDQAANTMSGDLIRRLNKDQSAAAFLSNVHLPPNMKADGITTRFGPADNDGEVVLSMGDGTSEKKKLAECAKCMLDDKVIPIHLNLSDVNEVYYPTCTRAKRCGGCCTTALYSCQPTEIKVVSLNVMVTQFQRGSQMMEYKRMESVDVQQHTKCECMCKVTSKDCHRNQQYKASECRCECADLSAEKRCLDEDDIKVWNYNICMCECREAKECSTGFYFNPKTCGCTKINNQMRQTGKRLRTTGK